MPSKDFLPAFTVTSWNVPVIYTVQAVQQWAVVTVDQGSVSAFIELAINKNPNSLNAMFRLPHEALKNNLKQLLIWQEIVRFTYTVKLM